MGIAELLEEIVVLWALMILKYYLRPELPVLDFSRYGCTDVFGRMEHNNLYHWLACNTIHNLETLYT